MVSFVLPGCFLFYLLSHSETPVHRGCLWRYCRNNTQPLSQDAACAVTNRDGWWAPGPLEFPRCSNLELSESGTFKERCQVICITSNVRAKLLQAKGTCTGSESDAQTTVCLELGDSRFPVSGLLLSVCAVTDPPPVSGSSQGGLCLLPAKLCLRKHYSLLPSINKGWPWCVC